MQREVRRQDIRWPSIGAESNLCAVDLINFMNINKLFVFVSKEGESISDKGGGGSVTSDPFVYKQTKS